MSRLVAPDNRAQAVPDASRARSENQTGWQPCTRRICSEIEVGTKDVSRENRPSVVAADEGHREAVWMQLCSKPRNRVKVTPERLRVCNEHARVHRARQLTRP
jgi:hypothetical protein